MSTWTLAYTAENNTPLELIGKMANRHGLIAGATGTGKTVSLRKMAESFSSAGVPVFLADVKGDLSGLLQAGDGGGKVGERMAQFGLDSSYLSGFPVRFWDVYGELGIRVRVTVSQMGAMLLARLLNLNDTQEGLLTLAFKVADDNGWQVIDFKDLRALLTHVADNAKEYRATYGNVSAASIGAIQRQLLKLESEGANEFFGEPALDLNDWLQTEDGKGVINVLAAEKLMRSPRLYGAFLLWFLAQIFTTFPEVGDLDRPKFVLFFDEAHLLFDNAPPALIEQIEQVVRLIRSKGVGVYFVTQNPLDLPDSILGQLGNRIQHALRAFTPRDQKAVKAAAQTFRANPALDVAAVIGELGVGEALVSFLDDKGAPSMVERAYIAPPSSRLPPLSEAERLAACRGDVLFAHYEKTVDNFSAYEALEALEAQTEAETAAAEQAKAQTSSAKSSEKQPAGALEGFLGGLTGGRKKSGQSAAYNVADAIGSQLNKQASKAISRGLMGVIKNLFK
ncbi:ATP-binding protein [Moraxella caviae]|uniref:ATP-binding protein n=1 Tax=Moraxella caviae TaxID=34060 RepID=A0A1T0A899_9GAMM|nr:helicase HerA-like domain-containing protein [Moraxella caviae]OOR91551.1 ATP-binding protein [Moraxella caviae]STZ14364.1 Ornithine/acetylornithine aminotransferase [Moraxella caviae]VEW12809.1 Ornithine/acetylornithine aminotransferase [Moraxella caviae]